MALTTLQVKNAKPGAKRRQLFDGGGLYLEISPNGNKWWRYRFRINGKARVMSLGTTRKVSLSKARDRDKSAMALVERGIDPIEHRKARARNEPGLDTFEAIAREWYEKKSHGKDPKYVVNLRRLELYVFPDLGDRPIVELDAGDFLDCLEKIVARGLDETARKTQRLCVRVYRYAIATRRARHNPAVDLGEVLPSPDERHLPAVTEPAAVGELLRAVWAYEGVSVMVRQALRILPYLFVRPGNLIKMRWEQLDLPAAQWLIPAEVMKMRNDHMVPLPRQAMKIITELEPLSAHSEWVFTGRSPDRPLSANTLNSALKTLGIDTRSQHTSHGWRATARTLLHERLHYPPEIIERQLAHRVPDMLGEAYNRTRFIEERREMMQAYADYLDALRERRGGSRPTRRSGAGKGRRRAAAG